MSFFYFGWEADCDACGDLLIGRDHGSLPHTKKDLVRELREVGCTINGDVVVCPDCQEKPDA